MGRFFLQRFNQLRAVQIHVNLGSVCVGGGIYFKNSSWEVFSVYCSIKKIQSHLHFAIIYFRFFDVTFRFICFFAVSFIFDRL